MNFSLADINYSPRSYASGKWWKYWTAIKRCLHVRL